MAGPGVVGMAVGDHGALDRPHRIDMEAAGLAAQAGGDRHQDVLRTHLGYIGRVDASILRVPEPVPPMPARLFLSSGDLIADRRFDFARDLQLKGDLAAAADLLLQATELAPGFASAWFTLGEIREQLGERDAAIAAFRKAREADPDDRHGAGLRLMLLGAEQLSAMPQAYVRDAVRSICAEIRSGAGRRSRLSRPGAAVQGGAGGARRGPQAGLLQARDRSRLRHRAGGDRVRQGGRSFHRHRPVAAHDREGAR